MEKKDIVKYFYETIVSENLLEELPQFIAEDCVVKVGEQIIPVGIDGMKQHLVDVKENLPRLYHENT